MKWFQHQSKAHTDAKLQKVLMKYGFQGYGLYWYCIENIVQNLEPKLTFELEQDSEILAHIGQMDSRAVEDAMLYMVNLGLFSESDGVLSCHKILHHLGDNLTRNTELKSLIRAAKHMAVSGTVSDSLRLSQQEERKGEEKRGEEIDQDTVVTLPKGNPIPVSKIVDLYHQKLPTLSRVQKMTSAREGNIKQRWREDLKELGHWENFFEYVSQSDFLMGRIEGRNGGKPFIANLEWITKAANYTKILEGNYHGV